jgi:hypothetical protein
MKPKAKAKTLQQIADACNPENEALLAVYSTKKHGEFWGVGDMELIRTGVRILLEEGIAGQEDAPETKVAWAILGALRDIQDSGADINELLTAFDESEDDDILCPDCNLFDLCEDKKAKAWRTIIGKE